ncbi:hypothetical protein HY256_03405 [Candidatus Sumerlaeota bacterium]|nr:hypothetical protein [Candidatus Sumerlaeota bacterium]
MSAWQEVLAQFKSAWPNLRCAMDRDGVEIVRSFDRPLDEVRHLRESVALLPNPDWRIFSAAGRDALDYLHRRLSHALKQLGKGEGAHALQLDADGRMLAELLIYHAESAIYLLSDRWNAEAIYSITEKFTLMDEVIVSRLWESECCVALAGPLADDVVRDIAPLPSNLSGWKIADGYTGGVPIRFIRDARWNIPFYHLSAPSNHLAALIEQLSADCRSRGGGPAGEDALEFMRITQGIPRFGVDTTIGTIPLEASLERAISFDKGCYPGQEIIARIRNLGHPARQLVRLEASGDREIACGAPITVDGQSVGTITSSCRIAGLNQTPALGFVKWRFRESPQAKIISAGGEVEAKMTLA